MGLDTSSIMFLCAAKSLGVDFSSTAMIGRQTFWPDPGTLRRVFAVRGITGLDADEFIQQHKYSEEFFTLLGAKKIASVDVSTYENANIIHDMNLPLPRELQGKFTCVHDGGTIEHVFNIPQAFRNCMEMVKVGGHFTQVNITNNFTGHGFWQFSPELIFRVFTEANGFAIEGVLMHEVVPGGAWYLVSDPAQIGQRVELCNDQPTYILTIAKRIAQVEIFQRPPQQSDYISLWDRTLDPPSAAGAGNRDTGGGAAGSSLWKQHIPQPLKRSIKLIMKHLAPSGDAAAPPGHWAIKRGFDPAAYRWIDEDALLRGTFR